MINKVVALIMLALAGSDVQAQTRKGFHIGISALYGRSNLRIDHGDPLYYELNPFSRKSFGGGFSAGYMFSDHAGIITGIERLSMGWKAHAENYYGGNGRYFQGMNQNQQITYTQIPFFVRLHTDKNRRIGFCAEIGFRLSVIKSAWTTVTENGSHFSGAYDGPNDEHFNKTSLTTHTFAGISVPFNDRLSVLIGPDFQYQISEHFSDGNAYEGHLFAYGVRLSASLLLFPARTPSEEKSKKN